jgi:hypothetical protein
MKTPCVKIWKLVDAPQELRVLYRGSLTAETWVALVPREIDGAVLDAVMADRATADSVSRHEMPNGDVFYWTS